MNDQEGVKVKDSTGGIAIAIICLIIIAGCVFAVHEEPRIREANRRHAAMHNLQYVLSHECKYEGHVSQGTNYVIDGKLEDDASPSFDAYHCDGNAEVFVECVVDHVCKQ